MAGRIIETFTLELLTKLLTGLHLSDNTLPKKSNYTPGGCEAWVEYRGQFYKISVEPVEL